MRIWTAISMLDTFGLWITINFCRSTPMMAWMLLTSRCSAVLKGLLISLHGITSSPPIYTLPLVV
ncbi:hypothetical protein NECAME_19173 [Necator americanus]|uniref:Uncharacterized protein n=1 Tax=Necator americanus TaxID=51031 RepID=W2SQ05_NECAM|nr:hypothetical protein NECAME_19173 [Necator americanus]ETN71779.1 hypothetical protein NECAME_19173 [Necator americanus]